MQCAVRTRRDARIMRNHQQAARILPRQIEQQVGGLVTGLGVQRTGRLVRQQQHRLVDERAGHRRTLPLPA